MSDPASAAEILELVPGSLVTLYRGWLSRAEADELADELRSALTWEQRDVVLFGRRVPQPRLIAWAGTLGYRYSSQTLEPRAAPPALSAVTQRVAAAAHTAFNHVLVNRYRDGNDGMGLHADDEPELGEDPVVASLSLGATRRFVLRGRARHSEPLSLELASGALLIMSGTTQRTHRHGIPKTARPTPERLSLTFRKLLRPPG